MKLLVFVALATVALADNAYPPPSYNAYRPAYYRPVFKGDPAKYEYAYEVSDTHYGPQFNANENRNGYATNGGYSVNLPDGRVQTVTYSVADGYSGYVADVSYTGEAQYPEEKPAYRPAYQPIYNSYQRPFYQY